MKNEHTYQRMIGVCLFVAHRTLRFSLFTQHAARSQASGLCRHTFAFVLRSM